MNIEFHSDQMKSVWKSERHRFCFLQTFWPQAKVTKSGIKCYNTADEKGEGHADILPTESDSMEKWLPSQSNVD